MTPHQSVMDFDEEGRIKLFKEMYAAMTLLRQPDKEMQGTQRQRPSQTHESHIPKRTHTTTRTHTHTHVLRPALIIALSACLAEIFREWRSSNKQIRNVLSIFT